ncbi:MAG: FtsW/RodA/SpoVE family cell cycle protein [Candidatus Eremiobacteraeota bacterium]|nr:FtsW/RodA/SpoVE family cell cycle protein [Candidatus Eremiobacteraeota bacterium]
MLLVRRVAPMVGALAVAALILHFAPQRFLGPPSMLVLLGALALVWVGWQPVAMVRDDVLPALAVVLASVGLAMIAHLAEAAHLPADLARRQELWILVSLVLSIGLAPVFANFRRFAAFKYLWVVASLVLFAMLLIFGQEINGARLWIRLGPIQYEPIELIKLFIVFFLAAYLAETADVIGNARMWSLRANVKYLGPLFIGWGASMAILVVQRDLGMATLLLATFATLLFVATRRFDIVFFGALLFAVGAFWAVHHYPYVQTRIAVWRNPFSDPLGAGYQSSQAYYSLASGGLVGTGYRLGHPEFIPDVATDYVYAAIAEEFGWIGAIVLLAIFLDVVRRIFATALQQPDLYTKLLATGLGATLGFQIVIIVSGVIGLLPLTGITLPFISYGGSSLVANFLLIALVWAMSARPRRIP